MTNKYNLSFVAEEDVMELVRRVRGKSPASLQQFAHTGRVKIVPRRMKNEILTVLQVFSSNRTGIFATQWSKRK